MNNHTIGYVIAEGLTVESDARIIAESSKRVIAEGILQTADETNRNGRIYRREDLAREISCPRTIELINAGQLRGEMTHPTDTSLARQQTVDGKNVCVKFLKLWMDGNNVMGQFRGTNNDLGEFFDADLRDGDKPSFSLRALGTINNKSGRSIVENLKLITYDNVIYPSHPNAYTTKIISESAVNNTRIIEESGKSLLIPITNEKVINYIKSESSNLNSILNSFDTLYESISIINRGKDVQLMDKAGNLFIVNLESYISNEIMDYFYKKL